MRLNASRKFHVTACDQRRWTARAVICASGTFQRPRMPELPGQAQFGGRLLHSSAYRNARPFAGQRVVVGAGNSGAQIAAELGRVPISAVSVATQQLPHSAAQICEVGANTDCQARRLHLAGSSAETPRPSVRVARSREGEAGLTLRRYPAVRSTSVRSAKARRAASTALRCCSAHTQTPQKAALRPLPSSVSS